MIIIFFCIYELSGWLVSLVPLSVCVCVCVCLVDFEQYDDDDVMLLSIGGYTFHRFIWFLAIEKKMLQFFLSLSFHLWILLARETQSTNTSELDVSKKKKDSDFVKKRKEKRGIHFHFESKNSTLKMKIAKKNMQKFKLIIIQLIKFDSKFFFAKS